MMRPLEGLLLLDFSTLLPGPMTTLLLAEAGAEVIKIERPGNGEEMRSYNPKWGRNSVNFAMLNRGKKSIEIDLKDPHQRSSLQPLIERADVIVEQFRPGVMERLGLDYESISKTNAKAIYCSITGYGQSGPSKNKAGHDLNFVGDTGLLALSMGNLANPVLPPAMIADIAGGAYPAFMNILLALHERQRTGRGCHLDIGMADNLFSLMYWALGQGHATGQWPGNGTDLVTGGTPRYRLYATGDGKMVAAAPIEQKFWDTFCEIIGLDPELRDDAKDPTATTSRVAEIIATKDAKFWRTKFSGKDCCCSIVVSLAEAQDDPQFRSRGLFGYSLVNEGGDEIPALPMPIVSAFRLPPTVPLSAPALGEHAALLSADP